MDTNPYLIIEGKTGFLVPPHNPKRLAEKIKFVFENPLLAKNVSKNTLKMIKRYDMNEIGEYHKSVIEELLVY